MTVDSVHDLIIVANRVDTGGRQSTDGILIFNRTDDGDVAPRGVIAGPRTGIIKIRQVVADDERGQIFATIKNNFENYESRTNAHRRGTPTRPGSSASGASTTTATCRRAASSRGRRPG